MAGPGCGRVSLCNSWACATHFEHLSRLFGLNCRAAPSHPPPRSLFLRLKEGSQLFYMEGHLCVASVVPLVPNSNCPRMVVALLKAVC